MKTLIVGGSGQLGTSLLRTSAHKDTLVATYHTHTISLPVKHIPCDLSTGSLKSILHKERPSVIIYTAALTDMSASERDPHMAKRIHADGVLECKEYCEQEGAYFIYISTSYVFDGRVGGYTEDDTPAPLGVYAKSKLQGEKNALGFSSPVLVLRVNFVGYERFGALVWPFDLIDGRKPLSAYTNRRLSALYVDDLAHIIWQSVERKLHGVYHVGTSDGCNRVEFLNTLLHALHISLPVTPSQSTDPLRPSDVTLDVTKLQAAGIFVPTYKETLAHMAKAYVDWKKHGGE